MWHHMFSAGVPLGERVIRAVLVYAFLLLAIRIFGKRELGQMTSFDIILLLSLSNMLQNAMIGNDNSVIGGVVGASVLLAVNLLVALVVFRFRRIERLVDGAPKFLVKDGRLQRDALRKELLTEQDILSAVRHAGVERIEDVRYAIAEPNGEISVIPQKK
jgi:uncharacterized membrane protein YcaP (DUF421 family)